MKKSIQEQKMEIYQQIEKIMNLDRKNYNRILGAEEKAMLGADAFGYLLSLYHYGSIDHIKLEKLIYCCVYVALRREEPLTLDKTKALVNTLLFYDNTLVCAKELIPFLNSLEEEAEFETVH